MTTWSAALGVALDEMFGEPPARWHPVARFGALMESVERRIYVDQRLAGVEHLAIGIGVALATGTALRRLLGSPLATTAATLVCVAGSMLDDEALAIAAFLEAGDLPDARARLSSLVGRSTADLDRQQVSRAVIESVAENCVDAVTAPIFWATLGGAPAVLAHRAVNTMDAMVGHPSPRYGKFGWASARLDDVANYVPARMSALAVAAVRPRSAGRVGRAVRRDAGRHPSPNGGIVEAAFAGALDVQLGGVNQYGDASENRGVLGDGRPADCHDIRRAVRLRRDCTAAVATGLMAGSVGWRIARRGSR